MYFSRPVVKRFFQLYKTTIFLAQLWMAASDHLFNKYNQKLKQVWCHVSSNCCSVLYSVSSKSRKHYSIVLKSSAMKFERTLIKKLFAFFPIINRSLIIKAVTIILGADLLISQKLQSRKKWDTVLKTLLIWIYWIKKSTEKLIL